MLKSRLAPTLVSFGSLVLTLFGPASATAQIYETVGTRAQGMAGAFVAVADDATATWWNPAGIAVNYFSAVIERGEAEEPPDAGPHEPSWRGRTGSFAALFPALGLSYYRLRISEIAPKPTTGEGPSDRQDLRAAGVRSFVTHQVGATFGQSLGRYLVVASTVRLVRAGRTSPIDGTLDEADELSVPLETRGDWDFGVLAMVGSVRVGAAVKHLREPEFGEGPSVFVLKRQARAGVSWVVGQAGSVAALTAAFDADLTRTPTALGDRRHVAAGAELRLPRQSLALRAGVSANTAGEVSRSTSTGASVELARGVFIDGAWTFGSDWSRKGWAVGLRLTD